MTRPYLSRRDVAEAVDEVEERAEDVDEAVEHLREVLDL